MPVYPGALLWRYYANDDLELQCARQGRWNGLFMPNWHSQLPPSSLLILGIISFAGAVVSTCTGKTWARTRHTIDRAKEPSTFWWVVAIYYLGAVLFIGLFLYQTYAI